MGSKAIFWDCETGDVRVVIENHSFTDGVFSEFCRELLRTDNLRHCDYEIEKSND